MTHPSPKRNMVPKAVLMRFGLVSLTTARPVNTAQPRTTLNSSRPMTHVFNKAHSTVRRPINNKTTTKNSNFNKRVNTVGDKNVNTARPKAVVNVARPKTVLNAVKGNQVNAVKDSACWVWKPKTKGTCPILLTLKKLIEDMLPLEVTPKKGKSQAELTDESHILFKVPRKNNMYSVDLKNIVPKGGLTCLFAKATSDESKLWHRRLGDINFKTMNKLVKGNLVRGLPSKLFENDQTCVACQKGKQHRASCKSKTVQKHVMMQCSPDDGFKPFRDDEKKITKEPGKEGGDSRKDSECSDQEKEDNVNITNNVNAASTNEVNAVGAKTSIELPDDPNMPELEDIVYSDDDENVGAKTDMNNLDAFMPVSPIPTTRIYKDHPVEQIIGDLNSAPQTGRMTKNLEEHEEPKKVIHALKDPSWIEAMQEELLQFKLQEVWTLVDLPNGKRAIGTKWVFRNKKDERGIVIKNKARLVAQGYTQEEGIDYDEVFAPVTRIKAIRLFLAYASFKHFVVYQMDVKSAFLYGKIEEEVYVCQPLGFEDPNFPDRVYKVEKALYGLHQAPRAWYETLSTYLLDNGFQRGKIDKTLFIKRDKGDILLVQVYVDDIIFGSTKKSLCAEFEKMTHKKFQMSSIGELTFFLGLQVKQKEDRIFISQDKYVTEILKKFGFTNVKTASTPMETQKPLLKDEDGEEVDVHLYRSMIGSLMYLTSSRPLDIMFCQPKLGPWYPKDSPFDLIDFMWGRARSRLKFANSTNKGHCQGENGQWGTTVTNLSGWEEDKLTRVGYEKLSQKLTFYKAFFSPQWKFLIHTVLQCLSAKTTAWNEFSSTMASAIISDEAVNEKPSMQLKELMDFCTKLQQRVLDLENTKTAQAQEITSLKKRVKKLEKKGGSRTYKLKRLYRVARSARVVSSIEAKITLVDETQGRYGDEDMFGVNDLDGNEVVVESEVTDKASEKRNIVEEAVAC
ncbi:putative ribonuclease H-like domain-containing protein [Tanacetum coccineum]